MIYHYMTSNGYIVMVIVDFCMIWFHFDCIIQLKKSYHFATNVCSRLSATTFGDLPDWSSGFKLSKSMHRYSHYSISILPVPMSYSYEVHILSSLCLQKAL